MMFFQLSVHGLTCNIVLIQHHESCCLDQRFIRIELFLIFQILLCTDKGILDFQKRLKIISPKLLRPSDESQIDFFLIQKLQRLISRLAGGCDTYMRKTCNISFPGGRADYISGKSRTGAQTQLWNVPGTVMANGIFSFIQRVKELLLLFQKESFTVRGQS